MEQIDAILYINLAHRTDRKEHMIHEIHKICADDSKIHRIDAILAEPGILGCGQSHKKAVEYVIAHPEWNRVLILEDDFTFHSNTSLEILDAISTICSVTPPFDVALLSHNHTNIRCESTEHPIVKKVIYSQTASSYLLTRSYAPILLQNMSEGIADMIQYGRRHENCIDIYWTLLQPHATWYTIVPALGYQYQNYSDIEKRDTNYQC
jgi:GR25 family glycosyltransferase involved in LPS biosynthesis